MAIKWYIDPQTNELFFPNGNFATELPGNEKLEDEAQIWALGIVSSIGISNLTDNQLIWLLSITMKQFHIGRPN